MNDKWKSAVLVFILVLAATAFALIWQHLGLSAPRMNWGFGSYTIDVRLSKFVGYFFAAFLLLYFCALVYAHFDQQRRMYKLFDRILEPVFNGVLRLLGIRGK